MKFEQPFWQLQKQLHNAILIEVKMRSFSQLKTYIAKKTASNAQRAIGAGLQLMQEILPMELPQLMQVAEQHALPTTQLSRCIGTIQL